jgi:hypothetical protein
MSKKSVSAWKYFSPNAKFIPVLFHPGNKLHYRLGIPLALLVLVTHGWIICYFEKLITFYFNFNISQEHLRTALIIMDYGILSVALFYVAIWSVFYYHAYLFTRPASPFRLELDVELAPCPDHDPLAVAKFAAFQNSWEVVCYLPLEETHTGLLQSRPKLLSMIYFNKNHVPVLLEIQHQKYWVKDPFYGHTDP